MKWLIPWVVLGIAGCAAAAANGQLCALPLGEAVSAFGGDTQTLSVVWRNAGSQMVVMPVRLQLYQASSSTVIPLGPPRYWKQFEILPGQNIIEPVSLLLPSVRARTRFLLQWLDASNQVLGLTDLFVYPTNLLQALKSLANGKPPGIFDPHNELEPLLRRSGLEFEDLDESQIRHFTGRLAIIGPFSESDFRPAKLKDSIASLAKSGAGVVWVQSSPEIAPRLEPRLYLIRVGRGTVAVVQNRAVADLAKNPLAQLNLLRSAELALKPDTLSLLNDNP